MNFDPSFIGPQGLTAEDLQYAGSRYAEIKEACFRNAYYINWGAPGETPLPVYGVTLGRVIQGLASCGRQWTFRKSAARALDAKSDLRWGSDDRGFRRLLHPNGVCLFGRWIIDQPTSYSGHFSQGTTALIVARYSTCCSETRRGYLRSLSMVGKLFPTDDPDHATPLQTANFITQEDLGGERTLYINDATLRNAPDVTPWRRGLGTPILLLTGLAFKLVDREPTIRQLYPIAELGLKSGQKTMTPEFMQLTVDDNQPRVRGDEIDFRDEVLEQIYDPGDPKRKRTLVFNIEVSDKGESHGLLVQRRTFVGWKRIGRIEFTEAVASYNGDFVLHFHHPPWRIDPNDPDSVVRQPKVAT